MPRIHFFELEDLPWFPKILRDAGTGFLNASHTIGGLDKLFIPKMMEILKKCHVNNIVDLGSGAGGPTPEIVRNMRANQELEKLSLTLTDYYPNLDARARYKNSEMNQFVEYYTESVDAAHVPKSLTGLRTMFLSFVMPFVKPFRWINLLLTYFIPVIPAFIIFDGWVSYFRTYSPEELKSLTESLPVDQTYKWEIGEVGIQRAPYILGYPVG